MYHISNLCFRSEQFHCPEGNLPDLAGEEDPELDDASCPGVRARILHASGPHHAKQHCQVQVRHVQGELQSPIQILPLQRREQQQQRRHAW